MVEVLITYLLLTTVLDHTDDKTFPLSKRVLVDNIDPYIVLILLLDLFSNKVEFEKDKINTVNNNGDGNYLLSVHHSK